MRILKRYFDEDHWEEVSVEDTKRRFVNHVIDVDLVIDELRRRIVQYTHVAEYKCAPDNK